MKRRLKERYAAANGRGLGRLIFACSLLACLFFCFTTVARYENDLNGRMGNVGVANFKFVINGKPVYGSCDLSDSIEPLLTSDSPKSGYFTVTLNPAETEVSFTATMSIDEEASTLPAGLQITSYSFDQAALNNSALRTPLPADNKVKKLFTLAGNSFSANDAVTATFFWVWNDGVGDVTGTVVVKVELTQYFG